MQAGGEQLATLDYGHAATIWRVNFGWSRRANPEQLGFVLDTERGYWARNDQAADDPEDPMSGSARRVIPFVEDRRNCLLLEPDDQLTPRADGLAAGGAQARDPGRLPARGPGARRRAAPDSVSSGGC